jgi:hypothetical protein
LVDGRGVTGLGLGAGLGFGAGFFLGMARSFLERYFPCFSAH